MGKAWFLVSLLLSSTWAFEQQILSEPTQNGVLRRFNVSRPTLKHILNKAQIQDLDIWQVTESHIDIYSPPYAPKLSKSLLEIPHSESFVSHPKTRSKLLSTTIDWNLTTLDNSTFHTVYHPLYEINAFMREAVESYPNVTRLSKIGLTPEGRDMLALTISTSGLSALDDEDEDGGKDKKKKKKKKKKSKKHPQDGPKLSVVIVGAQHSREWIATSTTLYIAHALLVNETEPHSLASLLDVYDFHIIPVPNPDGYDYTWETDRYWYKNRQIISSKVKCLGLDMNRNWGYKWKPEPVDGNVATTKPRQPVDPCSHWYPGSRPFESPEVNNIANFVTTIPDIVSFINLRSYGQMLSSPYSYSCKRWPKDAEDQTEAALGATQALKSVHGTIYQTGALCEMLYKAPGNIIDWMYARAGVKYSYVVHLRDTGTYGFSLPEKWIRPVGEETANMIRYIGKFIALKMDRKL